MRESAVPVLPCPDCGGRVPLRDASPRAWQECPKCGAGFRPVKADLDRALAADARAGARRPSRPARASAPDPAPAVVFEDVSAPPRAGPKRSAGSSGRTKRARAAERTSADKAKRRRPGAAVASRPASKPTPKPTRRRRFDSPEDGFDDSEDDARDDRPGSVRSAAPSRRAAANRGEPVRAAAGRRREASPAPVGKIVGGLMAGGFGSVLVVGLLGLKIWARYERAQRRHADDAAATSPAAFNQRDAWNPTLVRPQHEFASEGFVPDGFGDSDGSDADRSGDRVGGAIPPAVQLNPHPFRQPRELAHDPFRSDSGFPGDPSWDGPSAMHDAHSDGVRAHEDFLRRHEEFQRRHEERMERMGLTPNGFPRDRFGGPGGQSGFGGGPGF